MPEINKREILENAKEWFRDTVSINHIANTEKLADPNELNINPFTAVYLANFLTGNSSAKSIAKALLFPRVLGTSITTTFGMGIQKFTNDVLGAFGSTASGIDIEFIDQVDNERKYCQLKSGPNTINKDDVISIAGHFSSVINLGRTNNLRITHGDMIVGVIYGEEYELNSFYRSITNVHHFPVLIGNQFWYRLTGDPSFYTDLIQSIGSVAIEADYSEEFEDVINRLAHSEEIRSLANEER